MAYSLQKKGLAFAMLMTGESIQTTSAVTGVSLSTVRRWAPEAYKLLRECLQTSERGRELIAMGQRLRQARKGKKK